jgi:GTPase
MADPQVRHEAARSPEARLEEATGLARAIDLDVVESLIVNLNEIRPSTYLGKGKVEELAQLVEERRIALVVMDCALSPVQQRNLERALKAKTIDRTGLILEIFGRRARTREGRLQVELAHLEYQRSRLVRSWTHLERQRGGFGFLGGPGETQIETDRRLLEERMSRIRRDLDQVRRTRSLNRKRRNDVPFPIVALVGYTNAGKSTLFNKLTQAGVLAHDMLFATLDPTLRLLTLPHRAKVILSDTVGFISDLPKMLVSAFRATLEEMTSAEIILHVRDIAHPDSAAQQLDVAAVLKELDIDTDDPRLIEVWNKIDLVDDVRRADLLALAESRPEETRPALVSATTGQGTDTLLERIEARLAAGRTIFLVGVAAEDGSALHWLYENGEILVREDREDGSLLLQVRIASVRIEQLLHRFPNARASVGDEAKPATGN